MASTENSKIGVNMTKKTKQVTVIETPEEDLTDFFAGIDFDDAKIEVTRVRPQRWAGQEIEGYLETFGIPPAISLQDIKEKYGGGVYRLNLKGGPKNRYKGSKTIRIAGSPILPESEEEDEEDDREIDDRDRPSVFQELQSVRAEIADMKKSLSDKSDMRTFLQELTAYQAIIKGGSELKEFMPLLLRSQADVTKSLADGIRIGRDLSGDGGESGGSWIEQLASGIVSALSRQEAGGILGRLVTGPGKQITGKPVETEPEVTQITDQGQGDMNGKDVLNFTKFWDQALSVLYNDLQDGKPAKDVAESILVVTGPAFTDWLQKFSDERIMSVIGSMVDPGFVNEKKAQIQEVIKLLKEPQGSNGS